MLGKTNVKFLNKNLVSTFQIPLPITNNYNKTCYSSRQWLTKNFKLGIWGMLINKKYWDWLNFEFPNNTVYEDLYIDFFVIFEAKKFCAINKLVYNYTRHSSATSAYKKFSYEKFRNFTYQVFYFLKAVYIDPRFKKEEYKKCLATWFSAVAVVCA